jgi:hypothetical protein
MRTGLRVAALTVALVGAALWFFGGPNLGWTKTSVPEKFIDPVTEQEGQRWEKRFVPGVDFLGATLTGAGILAGGSFLFRKRR